MASRIAPVPQVWQSPRYAHCEDALFRLEISIANRVRFTVDEGSDDGFGHVVANMSYTELKSLHHMIGDALRDLGSAR